MQKLGFGTRYACVGPFFFWTECRTNLKCSKSILYLVLHEGDGRVGHSCG